METDDTKVNIKKQYIMQLFLKCTTEKKNCLVPIVRPQTVELKYKSEIPELNDIESKNPLISQLRAIRLADAGKKITTLKCCMTGYMTLQ